MVPSHSQPYQHPDLLLKEQYNLTGTLKPLAAYQDRNYLFTDSRGIKYILKISTEVEDPDFIRSQSRVLIELSKKPVGKLLPAPLTTSYGDYITEITLDGNRGYARLFPFLEGNFQAEVNPELSFYSDLGRVFGQIDTGMMGLEDGVLKSRTHEWDLARVMEVEEDVNLIQDPSDRRLTEYFLMKYREEVLPLYYRLPKSLIHGDGNDWNVLVGGGADRVAGIIDFGDMVWGARVQEIAIVLAYSMMGRKDFRKVYSGVIGGYQEIIKLTDIESAVLYYMIAARWCQTMVMAARQEKSNPGSAYHQVSVLGARSMLHHWIRQNPLNYCDGINDNPDTDSASHNHGRYTYFSKAVSLSYHQPIHMTGAAMQYMYSADGRTYLDCVNNIPHVGHCHPAVVGAGQRQMARLNTNTRYLYTNLDRYAEKLLTKFPPSLNKVFFVNSGSAATDLAVRLAEAYTGNSEFLVLDYAYHGNTKAAIGLSPYKFNRKGGKGKPGNVLILPTDLTGKEELQTISTLINGKNRGPCTFFAESIVGCAGQIVLSKSFMQETVRCVRETGGIYVADEVQTGFGRVGRHFWAYELYDVIPDMVILGKPMGNGHPMGAVVCTEAIARSFETGMEFFSSFGGNPVSCEIGMAVLEIIDKENLQQNALKVGEFLTRSLTELFQPVINKGLDPDVTKLRIVVRGSGLFLGIELTETKTGKPATEAATTIVNIMKERGFLLSTDGPDNNVIKFKPPMCFSMDNAKELTDNLRIVMNELLILN